MNKLLLLIVLALPAQIVQCPHYGGGGGLPTPTVTATAQPTMTVSPPCACIQADANGNGQYVGMLVNGACVQASPVMVCGSAPRSR